MPRDYQYEKWLASPIASEEVVITGISGCFPESDNIQELRDNLFNKVDMVTADDRRWKFDHLDIPKRFGKVNNIDKVDAGYFGLHYRQADVMDPGLRKMLEVAIEAVMDAGLNPSELKGSKTGVFTGVCYFDMESEILMSVKEPQNFGASGSLRSMMSNRISYYLGLKGPSYTMDGACSSSLTALETAFRSIRNGQCDNAFVCAPNLIFNPLMTLQYAGLGTMCLDGACKVFDQDADGYVRSEAAVCVFLQKAKNARRIYGQIVYGKLNCDGYKSDGITFPSSRIQQKLISDALKESGIDPSEISYFEAHGTGTKVGDPVEVQSIDDSIAKKCKEPLLIGSVKSNIGHTEGASGLCSLIKVIIAMETGLIAGNINFKNINRDVPGLNEKRMKVVTSLTKLDRDDAIIGINNFGFGGANAHVLIRRFKKIKTETEDDLPRLICVSGRTKEAVLVLLEELLLKPMDIEYLSLFHQIFKSDISGHLYRGFTIVSRNGLAHSSSDIYLQQKIDLFVLFGPFENGFQAVGKHLLRFPLFKTIMEPINKWLCDEGFNIFDLIYQNLGQKGHMTFGAFAVQLGIVKLLKLLELELVVGYQNCLGKLLCAYHRQDISFEEALAAGYQMVDKNSILDGDDSCIFKRINSCNNGAVLNVSDEALTDKNHYQLTESNFLEILGSLYERGHNPQVYKLYPEVQHPVSRGTPMISPLLKWNHNKSWYTYRFTDSKTSNDADIQRTFILSNDRENDYKYIEGHVVDGRNLIPATEYLNVVWQTFAQGPLMSDPVVFENCKFIRAVELKKALVKLVVSIQRITGQFEVIEGISTVATGRIITPINVRDYQTELPPIALNEDLHKNILEQDEIYRELNLRGYNYGGLFKGLVKCNLEATAGLVQWENNWTTFLDKMLHLKVLQLNTKQLLVPVGIRKVAIDPMRHLTFFEEENTSLCPVYAYKNCDIVKSGGIEISGIKVEFISRKASKRTPVLEKNIFVKNKSKMDLVESVRVNTQIILENMTGKKFTAVEIVYGITPNVEFVLPFVSKALDDLPEVNSELIISSKADLDCPCGVKMEEFVLTSSSNLLLIVATKALQKSTFKQILEALKPNGFILTREESDFVFKHSEGVRILTEHKIDDQKMILLQKSEPAKSTQFIEVSWNNYDWLPRLQAAVKHDDNVVVYNHNEEFEGIVGLVNCLRQESEGSKVKCFFMMDEAPKFDPQNPFYQKQIQKNMSLNIFKDKEWGTYRHLLLDESSEVESEHCFISTIPNEQLPNWKWIEGPQIGQIPLKENEILIYPYYYAINFKDVLVSTGRLNFEKINLNRKESSCLLGFEISGRDINGRRVMGWTKSAAIGTVAVADKRILCDVPKNWTFEEAATVGAVYNTVIYALLEVTELKPDLSILIHSGTGGIGLAAIHVCLYHKCEVFVTVGTEEKKDYLRKHFPEILECHIGSSRDTSFEEMIKTETKGRGVNIVLNSLAEDKLIASIRCLVSGGNFLEIGKFDLANDASLNLMLLEKNINYHGVALDGLTFESFAWINNKLSEGVKLGYVKPLPTTIFQKDEVEQAFQYMKTGKHTGKILVKIREEEKQKVVIPQKLKGQGIPRFYSYPSKCYIILGGLGGFGLELADWLFSKGARKLILVSRSGIQTGYQEYRIRKWKSNGVTVEIFTKDVTTKEGCLDLINKANELGPIDALFNSAVILKDALFEDQTEATFDISLGPKAKATKYLDELTRQHCPFLRYFVVFSSVSCGRGNMGQTNYGMANSVMERICEQRKRDGLPGLAIQWGAIGDVGIVANMQKDNNKEIMIRGVLQQKISNCLTVLDTFLQQENAIVASTVFAEMISKYSSQENAVNVVAYILGIKDVNEVNQNTPFAELGMDSITGTEVSRLLENDFEIYVTTKEIRSLTFKNLIEMGEEKKKTIKNENTTKERIGIEAIIKCPPEVTNLSIVNLPSNIKDNEVGRSVFVLPGVDGMLYPMEYLTSNLSLHVKGILYNYHNPEDSIQETAKEILPLIEANLKKNEAFNIIGYSFGVNISLEIAALLEEKGFFGNVVAIDGSPVYVKHAIQKMSQWKQNSELQSLIVHKIMLMVLPPEIVTKNLDNLYKCKDLKEKVDLALKLKPLTFDEKQNFDEQLFYTIYKRLMVMLNYEFRHNKIKSKLYLFKAKYGLVADIETDYQLSNLCENPVQVVTVEEDHASILNKSELLQLLINYCSRVHVLNGCSFR